MHCNLNVCGYADANHCSSAAMREVKYSHLAQSAELNKLILHDLKASPRGILPLDGVDLLVCPQSLVQIKPGWDENKDGIPTLQRALAQSLNADMGSKLGSPSFHHKDRFIWDGHQKDTLGGLKPDLVIIDNR